ncbi:MAG: DUF3108 domain-containing protein [Rikenellaceae bacterium]
MIKKFLFAIIALLLTTCVFAQDKQARFKSGEKLTYVVSYIAKLIPNIDVAEVTLSVEDSEFGGQSTQKITALAGVLPFFSWFFDMHDRYDTWIDPITLQPIHASCDISEGNYKFMSRIDFDWDSLRVKTTYRNLKYKKDKGKDMAIKADSRDALSLYYNLRSEDIENFKIAENRHLSLVMEDTVRRIDYKYLGRETKRVKGWGKMKTLKFSCRLVTSSGESFEDGTELFLWISDDENRVPLFVESPIRVGSVRVRLKNYENLKYPFVSKL